MQKLSPLYTTCNCHRHVCERCMIEVFNLVCERCMIEVFNLVCGCHRSQGIGRFVWGCTETLLRLCLVFCCCLFYYPIMSGILVFVNLWQWPKRLQLLRKEQLMRPLKRSCMLHALRCVLAGVQWQKGMRKPLDALPLSGYVYLSFYNSGALFTRKTLLSC